MLGPLQVVADGEALPLGGVKQRSVLALLLVRAGTVVSQDELVDAVWGESGSVSSVRSLQVYVSNLRQVLARHDSSGSSRIHRQGTGYVLDLDSARFDVARFEELAAAGREALRELRPEKARACLGEALALWRGRPLADFAYQEWARRETDRLDELRLAAVEDRIEADLVLGRHGELVAELEQLTAEHPYREAFAGQLMVALYRSGRQADALAAYQEARTRLVDTLGIEPGAPLKELEKRILEQDPALAAPAAAPALPGGTVTFLLTDVEESTRSLELLGAAAYGEALRAHQRVVRAALDRHGGVEVDTQGDSFLCAFSSARDAAAAVREMQDELAEGPLHVRAGLHTGEALLDEGRYVGLDVHRAARVGAVGHGGQTVLSASTAGVLEPGSFPLRDLGEHRLKDLSEPIRLYQLGDGDFPPLRTIHSSNLPVPATPFIGRSAEVAEIARLLAGRTRLVTLTGPGGSGKTRLALQGAAEAAEEFPDGITWQALAPLRDPALVTPSLAGTLGVKADEASVDAIGTALAGQRRLLVIDNCEHLLPGVAVEIARLREACPSVTLLVTSRERLQLAGEHVYPVAGLDDADSVELFLSRAAAAGADTEPVEAVRQLCGRLDRLPLAIELAAARAAVLEPAQLLERLGGRLDLLRGGRDADPRQLTLRATVQWSYDLLDGGEQELFRALSVFQGGCALEAAEGACGAAIETLQSLLDKSLLRRRVGADGERRFWMLETIREFGLEQLARSGDEEPAMRASHARWYAAALQVRARAIHLEEPRARAWVTAEIDNLRGAFTWLVDEGAVEEATAIAARLCPYFLNVAAYAECVGWARRVLALDPPPSALLGLLQQHAGTSLYFMGDRAGARALFEAAARSGASAGDDALRWSASLRLGRILVEEGDVGEAETLMTEAIARLRPVARPRNLVWALSHYAGSLTLAGSADRALPLAAEALEIARGSELEYAVGQATLELARISLHLGDDVGALGHATDCAARFAEAGDRDAVAYALSTAAEALAHLGLTSDAAVLAAVVDRIRAQLGLTGRTAEQESLRTRIEEALDPDELARLGSRADTLDDAEAVALALARSSSPAAQHAGRRG